MNTFQIAVIGAALLAAALPADAENRPQREHYGDLHDVDVVSIYDGDTFRITVPGWPAVIGERIRVRVAGVDTPEIEGDCVEEIRRAKAARDFARSVLRAAKRVDLLNIRRGTYFRLLAEVRIDGRNLAQLLIDAGHGRTYVGGKRGGWCD